MDQDLFMPGQLQQHLADICHADPEMPTADVMALCAQTGMRIDFFLSEAHAA